MIDNYQEEKSLEAQEPTPINFATVGAVYNDGVSLIFDGESKPSEKHYKVNSFAVFKAGDRVRILADSGTYVVEYPIGNPKKTFAADTATSATRATQATQVTNHQISNTPIYFASSGGKNLRFKVGEYGTYYTITTS